MDVDIDLENTEKGLHELFKFVFSTNCNIDEENVTTEESKTLEELEPPEILENFKDLVLNLLAFKKDYKTSDKAELAQRSEQFETLLQKLESEVRNHIRVEHQLKLHIETNQHRIEELEKAEQADKNLIKELEEKFNSKKTSKNIEAEKTKKELEEKVRSLMEVVEKKEKTIHKMEYENIKLRNLLEEKARECENAKKELGKITKIAPRKEMQGSPSTEAIKRFENSRTLHSQRLKDKSSSGTKGMNKSSLPESDILNIVSNSPFTKKESAGSSRKEENKSSARAVRGHTRSISDQKLLSFKREPSR